MGTETEPHATRAQATGTLPGPLLISNPSLGSSPTSQLYSFECVRVVPDPEKLSREPSATEVAISLLLIGSVLTANRRKAEHLWHTTTKHYLLSVTLQANASLLVKSTYLISR